MRAVAQEVYAAAAVAGCEDLETDGDGTITYKPRDPTAPARTIILAGSTRTMTPAEIRAARPAPSLVVVEDRAPQRHAYTLESAAKEVGARFFGLSGFVDLLWGAVNGLRWSEQKTAAKEDTSAPAIAAPPDATEGSSARYVFPVIEPIRTDDSGGADSHSPSDYKTELLTWIDGAPSRFDGQLLMLSGEAGVGKSKLTRTLQERSATNYRNALSKNALHLPPLALCVSLRNLDGFSVRAIRDQLLTEVDLTLNVEALFDHILRTGRLVLLLDGLDEVIATGPEVAEALRELLDLTQAGARILIAARVGTALAQPIPILQRSDGDDDTAPTRSLGIGQLDRENAVQLLVNYGEDRDDAGKLFDRLPTELSGNPLFLLWSRFSELAPEPGQVRARALLQLVEGVCVREESLREISMPPEKQIEWLSEIALHLLSAPMEREMLRAVVDDVQFVDGPHALLHLTGELGESIEFRHEAFEALLLAHALDNRWKEQKQKPDGFKSWLTLGAKPFEELTIEYLGELLEADDVRTAWTATGEIHEDQPNVRRNILAISLQIAARELEITSADDVTRTTVTPAERARRQSGILATMIPDRNLTGCHLNGLVLENFAFAGWTLTDLHGNASHFEYCDFVDAHHDSSLIAHLGEGCTPKSLANQRTKK